MAEEEPPNVNVVISLQDEQQNITEFEQGTDSAHGDIQFLQIMGENGAVQYLQLTSQNQEQILQLMEEIGHNSGSGDAPTEFDQYADAEFNNNGMVVEPGAQFSSTQLEQIQGNNKDSVFAEQITPYEEASSNSDELISKTTNDYGKKIILETSTPEVSFLSSTMEAPIISVMPPIVSSVENSTFTTKTIISDSFKAAVGRVISDGSKVVIDPETSQLFDPHSECSREVPEEAVVTNEGDDMTESESFSTSSYITESETNVPDFDSPIALTAETTVYVKGKKCLLRVDEATNQLVAYPIKPHNPDGLSTVKRSKGRPRKHRLDEYTPHSYVQQKEKEKFSPTTEDSEKPEVDTSEKESHALEGLLGLSDMGPDGRRKSLRTKRKPKVLTEEYEIESAEINVDESMPNPGHRSDSISNLNNGSGMDIIDTASLDNDDPHVSISVYTQDVDFKDPLIPQQTRLVRKIVKINPEQNRIQNYLANLGLPIKRGRGRPRTSSNKERSGALIIPSARGKAVIMRPLDGITLSTASSLEDLDQRFINKPKVAITSSTVTSLPTTAAVTKTSVTSAPVTVLVRNSSFISVNSSTDSVESPVTTSMHLETSHDVNPPVSSSALLETKPIDLNDCSEVYTTSTNTITCAGGISINANSTNTEEKYHDTIQDLGKVTSEIVSEELEKKPEAITAINITGFTTCDTNSVENVGIGMDTTLQVKRNIDGTLTVLYNKTSIKEQIDDSDGDDNNINNSEVTPVLDSQTSAVDEAVLENRNDVNNLMDTDDEGKILIDNNSSETVKQIDPASFIMLGSNGDIMPEPMISSSSAEDILHPISKEITTFVPRYKGKLLKLSTKKPEGDDSNNKVKSGRKMSVTATVLELPKSLVPLFLPGSPVKECARIGLRATEKELGDYKCSKCDHQSYYERQYRDHISTHPDAEIQKCKCCPFVSLMEAELLEHFKAHHLKCICPQCDYMAEHQYIIKRHMQRHNPNGSTCEICGKKYKDQYILKMHVKMVHLPAEVLFECEVCQKKFTRKAHLKRHMRIHDPEKPFKCPHCDYRGCERSDITKHILIHEEPKFCCEVCGKSFRHIKNKELHLKRHRGQRDYKCGVCDFYGYTFTDIRKHIERKHADSRNILCPNCGITFRNEATLKEHKKMCSEMLLVEPGILVPNSEVQFDLSKDMNTPDEKHDILPGEILQTGVTSVRLEQVSLSEGECQVSMSGDIGVAMETSLTDIQTSDGQLSMAPSSVDFIDSDSVSKAMSLHAI